jgi:hypothetical protein
MPDKGLVVVDSRGADRGMIGCGGLDNDAATFGPAATAACDLRDQRLVLIDGAAFDRLMIDY